jgi:hypothetical protein
VGGDLKFVLARANCGAPLHRIARRVGYTHILSEASLSLRALLLVPTEKRSISTSNFSRGGQ